MDEMAWMTLATAAGLAIAILILVGALRFADAARKGNRRFKWLGRFRRTERPVGGVDAVVPSPDGAYSEPADVLAAHSISKNEKVRLLEQWRYDVLQLQVAATEGLAGTGSSGEARLLSRIDRALAALGEPPPGTRASSARG